MYVPAHFQFCLSDISYPPLICLGHVPVFLWHADILFPGTERFKLFFRGLQTVLKSGNIFKRIIHRQVPFFGFMVLKSDSSGISVLPCAVPVSGSHIFGTKNIFQISALFTMEYGST